MNFENIEQHQPPLGSTGVKVKQVYVRSGISNPSIDFVLLLADIKDYYAPSNHSYNYGYGKISMVKAKVWTT